MHLVDVPGFVIGIESERAGTIRSGARALSAICQAKVPWCSIIVETRDAEEALYFETKRPDGACCIGAHLAKWLR